MRPTRRKVAWALKRRATQADHDRLGIAMIQFVGDYKLPGYCVSVEGLEEELDRMQRNSADDVERGVGRILEREWVRIVVSLIGDEGILHGYVGHHCYPRNPLTARYWMGR